MINTKGNRNYIYGFLICLLMITSCRSKFYTGKGRPLQDNAIELTSLYEFSEGKAKEKFSLILEFDEVNDTLVNQEYKFTSTEKNKEFVSYGKQSIPIFLYRATLNGVKQSYLRYGNRTGTKEQKLEITAKLIVLSYYPTNLKKSKFCLDITVFNPNTKEIFNSKKIYFPSKKKIEYDDIYLNRDGEL